MPDQEEKKLESNENIPNTRPTNAATEYGLEDHVATQQDPRVLALKKAEEARRLSTQSGGAVRQNRPQVGSPPQTDPPSASKTTPQSESASVTPPESPSKPMLRSHQSWTERKPQSEDQPYNAATDFGLEEAKATRQDPRVERILISERKPRETKQTPTAAASRSQLPSEENFQASQAAAEPSTPMVPREAAIPPAPPNPVKGKAAPKQEEAKIPPPPPRPEDVRMPPPTMYSSGCVTGACTLPARTRNGRGRQECHEDCGLPCRNPNQADVWKDPEDDDINTKKINTDYTVDPAKEFTRARTSTEDSDRHDTPVIITPPAHVNLPASVPEPVAVPAPVPVPASVPVPTRDPSDESEKVTSGSTRVATDGDTTEATASDSPKTKKPLLEDTTESESSSPLIIPPETDEEVASGSEPAPTAPPTVEELFREASKQVRAAGAMALEANKVRQEYTTKLHEHDILTSTDKAVEDKFIKEMSARYPTHQFIGEEAISKTETGQVELTDEPTWIIDPIDGTMNYVHRFPYYCISVALVLNKRTEFGIVYNPPMDEMYTAHRGKGAFLNGEPIKTSGQQSLEQALVLQEYSTGMNEDRNTVVLGNAKRLLKKTHAMRSIGSSAMGLAMVASGVADAFYYFGLHIWDMAAGVILVQEAGGVVIDPAGGELDIMSRRCLAAASMPLALELSEQLDQNYPSPRDDQPARAPKVETKDFFSQTDFSDSSDSLTTENSSTPTHQKPPVSANQEV
ncbi:proteoglycan 4 [Drosophila madeirensis]|uniref:inositol-phosphate phosphatase n=1 Tax=Drosophila madeirensis TaxID=30013 RepID=A0AAU9FSZ8_DROMD